MRFATTVTLLIAATLASAYPTQVKERAAGDVQTIAKGLCFLEAGLGVTSLEDFLDKTLGGSVSSLEKKLGVTDLEDAAGLTSCEGETKGLSDLKIIGKGLCNVEKGLGLTDALDQVDKLLGGAVTGLEDILGVTSLEKELDLSGC